MFRYAQLCPMARAAEVVGERWTLLIVRELALDPKRFSDLRSALRGISASVLTDRLERLEERGVIERHALPPPAASAVYRLTESGRGLLPALTELARWGLRFLDAPRPGDHFEPDWGRLALALFARRTPTPARCYAVSLDAPRHPVRFRVAGGSDGTRVLGADGPADARIHCRTAFALMGLASGGLDFEEGARSGQVETRGDASALADFSALFDFQPPGSGRDAPAATHPEGD